MATFTVTTARDVVDARDGQLSLREAAALANATEAADTIRFASDLDDRSLTLSQGSLALSHAVTIDGDADNDGAGVTLAGGGDRLLVVRGGDAAVTLADLALTGGRVSDGEGGAILMQAGGELTVRGCTLSDNQALRGNGDEVDGGAIYAGTGSRVAIIDSVLRGNLAYGEGGAIATAGGVTLTIRDSELSGNEAYDAGGAIALRGGSRLVVERSNLSDNGAGSIYDGRGGAILVRESAARIVVSSLTGNVTVTYGGALAIEGGSVRVETSTIAGNIVRDRYGFARGGGIEADEDSDLSLARCTITGNFAAYTNPYARAEGGGGIATSGRLRLSDSVVTGNFTGYDPSDPARRFADDVEGRIDASNGRNLFGSAVTGAAEGDRQDVSAGAVFAELDPANGGGRLVLIDGRVLGAPLRDRAANPALAAGDPFLLGGRGWDKRLGDGPPDLGAVQLDDDSRSTRPSAGNDAIAGTPEADLVRAGLGADLVAGRGGNDLLYGDRGSDLLDGGEGQDALRGGLGADILQGGDGADRLFGESGVDRLAGGSDGDRLDGGTGDDLLHGGSGSDVLQGGAGRHDVASWLDDGSPARVGVLADLEAGQATRGGAERDRLAGIEDLLGTRWNDTLRGDGRANLLSGSDGADRLLGGGGDDLLEGGRGDDALDGGAGSNDRVDYTLSARAVLVRLAEGDATSDDGTDRLRNVEGAIGSAFDDELRGNALANEFSGLGGNDVLYGGLGADRLEGGVGADRFVYASTAESPSGAGHDVIVGFAEPARETVDRLDLAAIDAVAATKGDDAFTWIDDDAFSAAGQLRIRVSSNGLMLEANTGGSLAPDLEIELAGTFFLNADSFAL